MEEENYKTEVHEEENSASNLRNILLKQKEKLAKNAKKKKRFFRQKWHELYIELRRRHVAAEARNENRKRSRKIERFCVEASNFVLANISFDPIIEKTAARTDDFFMPLKNVGAKEFRVPKQDELVNNLSQLFAYNFDFSRDTHPVAAGIAKKVEDFGRFELIRREPLDLDDVDPSIPERAAENMDIICAPIDSRQEARGLLNFSQDMLLFTKVSSMDAIADVAANIAVSKLDLEKSCAQTFDSTVLPQMRPFLRLAFPRWDNDVELTIDRGDTLDPDSITTFFNEKTETISDPTYLAEANEMLGDTEALIDEFSNAILPIQLKDYIYDAIGIEDLLDGFPQEPAALIANDPNQDIIHSMGFVDEELRNGLAEFCGSHIRVDDVIQKISSIQLSLFKQNVANSVALLTFGNLSTITPFLKGAADVKRHKMDYKDSSSLTRKWKDEMMNKIRQFLD
jgi:hypothetical protein